MRYSTNEDGIGYKPWQRSKANGERILVYLDGVEVKEVLTVDTLKGYIKKAIEPVHVIDVNGEQEIATEVLRGDVTIKFELKAKE